MIGIGGFAEATLVGMGLYILVTLRKGSVNGNLFPWQKDIVVVAISLLLLLYWSYVDPHSLTTTARPAFCSINSHESLSWTEGVKITCMAVFGICCNHSPLTRIRKIMYGVAIGLSAYVIPTVIGSIALQGIRGGGDKVYDIFSGNISAQSTTAGYIVIMIIGILGALEKRRILILSIGLALITGIQTSNRSVILFGALGCVIECSILLKSQISSIIDCRNSVGRRKLLFLFGALAMASLSLISGSQFIYSRITAALDGRLGLYIAGYNRLFNYLLNPINNLLLDAGSTLWWHSVPLDATRSGNLIGAYLSLAWLAGFIIGIAMSIKKRQTGLCLLGFALLFIYMTGMPLSAGGYELVALYCGYLLFSNEVLTNTQT